MTTVSIDQAAELVGVSSATIRNWMKAGHITAAAAKPVSFLRTDVLHLKNQLSSGELAKLRARANKSASASMQARKPKDAGSNSSHVAHQILNIYENSSLDISGLLFVCVLRVLELAKEIESFDWIKSSPFKTHISAKRKAVSRSVSAWQASLKYISWKDSCFDVRTIIKSLDDDLLGDIYQVLTVEGDKSNKGAYYTPIKIVHDALASAPRGRGAFLDLCCGSGRYLVAAAKFLNLLPSQIHGFDTDPLAVRIAKINLLLAYPENEFEPLIYQLDAITELATGQLLCETNNLQGTFGVIATNPPWGSYKNSVKNSTSKYIESNEAFSLFLEKALQLLQPSGFLSFIFARISVESQSA